MFKKLILLVFCVVSLNSQAATISAQVTIKTLKVLGTGNFVVVTHEPLGGNCYTSDTTAKVYYHSVNMTQEGLNRTLSVLLAAKATNLSVIVYFDDSSRNCFLSAVELI